MSHLDEGTLHALLDGELDIAEISEIQKHLGSCVACGSRLQEVKQVLLVPEPIDANARRKRWLRGLRWAAVVAVVVYGGKMIGGAMGPSHPVLPERDLTSASPAVPPAVASPEETRRPGATVATRQQTQSQARTPAPRSESRPAPAVAQRTEQPSARLDESASPDTQSSVAAGAMAFQAADTASDTLTEGKVAAADRASDSGADSFSALADEDEPAAGATEEDRLATRRAAAAALAELDRERRRQRANAATASLPPPARPETAAAEAAPRPPTLEQRSQVYLRIGLDEAVRQLGGPVHVIEGMTPEFIGLTRSQIIPGTSSSRPVVRVVYTDARGRLILLDQQRMESPQNLSPSGSLRWTIGDVMLYLRGDVSTDVLRGLQARVR
jgi:hypothetical protein